MNIMFILYFDGRPNRGTLDLNMLLLVLIICMKLGRERNDQTEDEKLSEIMLIVEL